MANPDINKSSSNLFDISNNQKATLTPNYSSQNNGELLINSISKIHLAQKKHSNLNGTKKRHSHFENKIEKNEEKVEGYYKRVVIILSYIPTVDVGATRNWVPARIRMLHYLWSYARSSPCSRWFQLRTCRD